ncbi:8752_t:CDS:1, partial [Acaulospora morrowiae]
SSPSTVYKVKLNAMVVPNDGTIKNDFITVSIPYNQNFCSLKKEVLKHTSFQNFGEDQITVGKLNDEAEIEEVFEKYNKEREIRKVGVTEG